MPKARTLQGAGTRRFSNYRFYWNKTACTRLAQTIGQLHLVNVFTACGRLSQYTWSNFSFFRFATYGLNYQTQRRLVGIAWTPLDTALGLLAKYEVQPL